MIKFFPGLILIAMISCTTTKAPVPISEGIPIGQPFIITQIDSLHMTIIKIPEISEFLFLNDPGRPLAEVASDSGYALAVNASYFDYEKPLPLDRTKTRFLHAGFLRIKDSLHADLMAEERQLTALLAYDFERKHAEHFTLDELKDTEAYDFVVQTGPQIIRDGIVQGEEIKNSINGMGEYARTAFASVDGEGHYIILVKKTLLGGGIDLIKMGEVLLESGLFEGNLNVVNLDGGSSTSLYMRDNPDMTFHSGRQILPAMIVVK